MIFYVVNIFLSAFLLFQIQPLIAKYILPWFGGTSAVWSTVQMYFQILLTGGYAYANWLAGSRRAAWREALHIGLLCLALAQMVALGFAWASPVTPGIDWRPAGLALPVWEIFKILSISVGPAYFLLSTNSPIMQAWFSRAYPQRSPYMLYALSNAGSLLALITYPIFVEPTLALAWQGRLWSAGFAVFAVFTIYGAARSLRAWRVNTPASPLTPQAAAPPTRGAQVLWLALSACASILLLAVTSQITQEVAVIPFLWVLPLAAYLLTFILAFADEKWYPRQAVFIAFYLVTLLFAFALMRGPALGIPLQVLIYTLLLFIAAWACHGELYRLRPHPAHLTRFYLLVSIGGALGGMFVNLLAPLLFKGFWELPLGVLLAWALIMFLRFRQAPAAAREKLRRHRTALSIAALVLLGAAGLAFALLSRGTLFVERNFYGLVRVDKVSLQPSGQPVYKMVHGITVHGVQYLEPALRRTPTAYYSEHSGLGLALLNHPLRGKGMRVGEVGMGAGVLAAYGQPGDLYRLYEINPAVIRLAQGERGFFSFLQDSPARVQVVAGDARISLERELQASGSHQFDVLVLDAFSSDSIPVHLIDRQAFELYLAHLKPGGLLAVHITNNYLDLRPVLWSLSRVFHLEMSIISDPGDGQAVFDSQWVLLTSSADLLQQPAIASRADPADDFNKNLPPWTDDYSNLFQILR